MATRDWDKIKTEYVTGEIDARALAEKHAIAYPTLRDRMNAEDWVSARSEHRSKLVAKTLEYAEQAELTARAMAGRATNQAFQDFATLPARERGKRFPELLKLWAAMTGEMTERSSVETHDYRAGRTDAEIDIIETLAREANERLRLAAAQDSGVGATDTADTE